jgi:hypothetical protein
LLLLGLQLLLRLLRTGRLLGGDNTLLTCLPVAGEWLRKRSWQSTQEHALTRVHTPQLFSIAFLHGVSLQESINNSIQRAVAIDSIGAASAQWALVLTLMRSPSEIARCTEAM